ncbi:MAG: histidine kinase dimerization/phospho-acceptor domain-containing protein [Planctomycetota bacterium]
MPTTDPRAFLHVPSPTPSAPRGNDRSGPVARLAGGLAHGFNNLLTVLRGNAELLRGSLVDSRQKALLDAMLVACGRAHALTQQLLTYSGQQVIRPQWLEINTWLAEWLERHRVQLPGDVEARFVPCSLSTSVHIDPAQLAEVVSRLIVFACDAILAKPDGGGRIDLRTDCVHNPVGLPSGEYVRLAVAHDGRGMDETALAGIFEP